MLAPWHAWASHQSPAMKARVQASIVGFDLLDDVAVLPLPVTAERLPGAVAEPALKLAATDFVLVELNPVIVHAHGAVAVDALADEEVLR